jgi:hypothetical protein
MARTLPLWKSASQTQQVVYKNIKKTKIDNRIEVSIEKQKKIILPFAFFLRMQNDKKQLHLNKIDFCIFFFVFPYIFLFHSQTNNANVSNVY